MDDDDDNSYVSDEDSSSNDGDIANSTCLFDDELLYPSLIPQWKVSTLPNESECTVTWKCEECESRPAIYNCRTCKLLLCETCTNSIHIVKEYVSHLIYRVQDSDVHKGLEPFFHPDEEDDKWFMKNHLESQRAIPSVTLDAPAINTTKNSASSSVSKFRVGQNVMFAPFTSSLHHQLPESADRPVILHGTIVEADVRTGAGKTPYYRVLWARGVYQLPNLSFQAQLTFPYEIDSKNWWPIPVAQYVNQWFAIKAVAVAEETARGLWRRDYYAKRRITGFASPEELGELLDAIDSAIDTADVEIDPLRTNDLFISAHASGKWKFEVYDEENTSAVDKSIPWKAHERLSYYLVAEHDIETLEEARPRMMRRVILHMLMTYLGCYVNKWKETVLQMKAHELQNTRRRSIVAIEEWYVTESRRISTEKILEKKKLQVRLPDVVTVVTSTPEAAAAITSAKELAGKVRERNKMASRLYRYYHQALQDRLVQSWKHWASQCSTVVTKNHTKWHPGLGVSLPRLPLTFTKTSNVGALVITDLAKYKVFKANHFGPTDHSYWGIKGRVMCGAYPTGQARDKQQIVVARSDALACILMESIGTFVSLLTANEIVEQQHECTIKKRWDVLETEFANSLRATKARFEAVTAELDKLDVAFKKERLSHDLEVRQLKADRYQEARDELVVKKRIAEKNYESAKEHVSVLRPVSHVYFPIEKDVAPPSSIEFSKFVCNLEERLAAGENLYIFSSNGHGRPAMVLAILLGRLYGITSRDALHRTQRLHDTMGSLKSALVSAPQSIAQRQFVEQVVSTSSDMIYSHMTRKDDEGKRESRFHIRGANLPKDASDLVLANVTERPTEDMIQDEVKSYKDLQHISKKEARVIKLKKERLINKNENQELSREDIKKCD